MSDLVAFLQARIAEDEQTAQILATRDEQLLIWGRPLAARILAEVDSKRRLVDLHTPCDDWAYGDPATCPELRLLASVYSDHPEYRDEWKP